MHLGGLCCDSLPQSIEHPPGSIWGEIPPGLGSWGQPHVQILIIVPELSHGTPHHLVVWRYKIETILFVDVKEH